jgi:hypothetical protein
MTFSFDGYSAVTVPSVTASPTGVGFVAQGAAIPVRQLDTTGSLTLTPKKLAVAFVLSNEIVRMSTPNAEQVVRTVGSENVDQALDAALFGTQAGNVDQPSGLLRGLTTLGATAIAAGVDVLRQDIGKLANAVAGVGGDQIAFAMNPATALKVRLALGGGDFAYPIFSSGQIAVPGVCATLQVQLSSPQSTGDVMDKLERIAELRESSAELREEMAQRRVAANVDAECDELLARLEHVKAPEMTAEQRERILADLHCGAAAQQEMIRRMTAQPQTESDPEYERLIDGGTELFFGDRARGRAFVDLLTD